MNAVSYESLSVHAVYACMELFVCLCVSGVWSHAVESLSQCVSVSDRME